MKLPRRCVVSTLLVVACAAPAAACPQDDDSLSRYYGFRGIEVFKLENRSANMVKGDFNNDGLLDVMIADNSHSRLDLLQQRKEGEPEKSTRVNEIKNDWRLEHVKIPVDRQVVAMEAGDFNNDGAEDIAYFGSPDVLVVRYQSKEKKADWSNKLQLRLPNVTPNSTMMSAGDLNGDGREDLVVLGKTSIYLVLQEKDGKLQRSREIPNTSTQLSLIQVADLDGDGRQDLSYVATNGSSRNLCARLQAEDGEIGPELQFDLNRPRSVTLFNLDETPATEILTIDSRTGRISVSRIKQPEQKSGEMAARLTQYGFGEEGTGKDRDLAMGDIDGDGLQDIVLTDPDRAQMLVFSQAKGRGLGQAKTYPGLLGANHVRIADLDGDKRGEVIVMSPKEKVLAVSRFADGRLTFPRTLPRSPSTTPLCFEIADLDGNGTPEVVYLATRTDGRKSQTVLGTIHLTDGEWQNSGADAEVTLELPGKPNEMKTLDVNNDGRSDLMVFFDLRKPPVVLLNEKDGKLKPLEETGGFRLGKLEAGNVTISGSTDKTGIIVAQETFARRLSLDGSEWQVADQYNAAEAKAEVGGSAELNLDGADGNEIVLIDTGIKKLRVLRKSDNVYRPWKEVELGSIEYRSSRVGDLNGDGRDDLVLVGKGRFAVLYAGQTDPVLDEVASFETKLDRAYFQDLIAGDVNADGRPDIAAIDSRSHYIEFLNYSPSEGLQHAMQFKVFEEKSFTAARTRAGTEPREAMIADVTGDGRSDLLLLIHDRMLVYPQDPGKRPVDDQ